MSKDNPVVVFPSKAKAEIQYREIPNPEHGEILVKNRRSIISIGTEMTAFSGDYPAGSVWEKFFPYPFDAGYATAGEVVDVGEGVDKMLVGRRVATTAPHSLYACVKVEESRLIQREEVAWEEAPFFIIAQIVMRGIRLSKVSWGDSVAVYGLGPLGYFAANLCIIAGACNVFAIDTSDFRLNLLPEDACLVKVNPRHDDLLKIVSDRTRGRLVDIVFEVTGNARLIPDEFKILRDQGRFVVVSSPRGKTEFDFHDLCNRPSYTIIGAHNYSHPPVETPENPWTMQRHSELFFDLVADKKLDVGSIISHRIHWSEAPEIYYQLAKDPSNYLGIVIDWEGTK